MHCEMWIYEYPASGVHIDRALRQHPHPLAVQGAAEAAIATSARSAISPGGVLRGCAARLRSCFASGSYRMRSSIGSPDLGSR